MPFICNGSVEKYKWKPGNIHVLNALIIQTVLSLACAFERIGFIHGDLHPGNLLLKPTKRELIKYKLGKDAYDVPTFGCKIVLMDFEKSITELTEPEYFWSDMRKLFTRLDGLDVDMCTLEWKKVNIISFTESMIDNKMPLCNVAILTDMIHESEFVFRKNATKPFYNPSKYN